MNPALAGVTLSALLAATAHAYEVADVAGGAAVAGRVTFAGNAPRPESLLIGKDHHVCGRGHVEQHAVRTGSKRGLRDVVVFVEGVERGKPWPAGAPATVVQRDCAFFPFLQVVPEGGEVVIVNEDPVLHNIHLRERIGRARRTMLNIGQPRAGARHVYRVKTRRSPFVEVTCDAHHWMQGYMVSLEHPYFAVVDDDGRFHIDDLPPGEYELTAWHPHLGIRTATFTVAPDAAAEVRFEFDAT